VEPKRKRHSPSPPQGQAAHAPSLSGVETESPSLPESPHHAATSRPAAGRELRRARIIITVKRTENYKQWLEENPLQEMITGEGEDVIDDDDDAHS
jgi:hypothetical protein